MGVADGEYGGCACGGGSNGGGSNGNGDAISNGKPLSRGANGHPGDADGLGAGASGAAAVRPSPAAALGEWLASLGLGGYEKRLVSQGFDTLEAMGTATEADLEAMGFKKGHLRLLLARASSATLSLASSVSSNNGGGASSAGTASPAAAAATAAKPSPLRASPPSCRSSGKVPRGITSIGGAVGGDNGAAVPIGSVRGIDAVGREERGTGRGVEDEPGEEKEDGEGRYADALALQPLSALRSESFEGGGGGGRSGRGEEFKELRPEEVEIDAVIGEGSFGVVRRAKWRGMDVAVKELKVSIAYVAAAASSAGSGGSGDLAAESTAGAGLGAAAAVGAGVVGGINRQRVTSMDGEEEMRHEARMLAKVCNHVW